MPRLKGLSVVTDVVSDASLRLAVNSAPSKFEVPSILRSLGLVLVCILVLAALAGCAGSEGQKDDTDIWSESKLYSEATDRLNNADFGKCGKYFEKLEARFPFGPYSQQAQINAAYCYWKAQDTPQAMVAIDRFIKLHQGSDNLDYAYYLLSLIHI